MSLRQKQDKKKHHMEITIQQTKNADLKDKKIAAIVSGTAFVVLLVTLYLFGFSIPTPPIPEQLLYKDAEMELIPLEDVLIETGTGGGGSGTPADAQQTDEYVPQTQQVLTQSTSSSNVRSGASTINNTNRSSNNPTSAQQTSNNPFGSGGSGGGDQGGIGRGIGNDEGDGKGPGRGEGTGGNIKRERIKDPNSNGIPSDERGKVVVRVNVDQYGDVVGVPTYDRNLTTISNTIVINKVVQLVKEQAKWNRAPGAKIFTTAVTVSLSPK
ncbi:MAG: hypothetical protein RLZZ493_1131 [Bacteroidota bacterium]